MSARVTICLAARSLRSIPKLASASGTSSSHRMTFTIGLMLHADRNAFFYVLDRTTGEFLLGKPFARQTWAKGLDQKGRPILVPNSEASLKASFISQTWEAPPTGRLPPMIPQPAGCTSHFGKRAISTTKRSKNTNLGSPTGVERL